MEKAIFIRIAVIGFVIISRITGVDLAQFTDLLWGERATQRVR